jgi:hypothetical protein
MTLNLNFLTQNVQAENVSSAEGHLKPLRHQMLRPAVSPNESVSRRLNLSSTPEVTRRPGRCITSMMVTSLCVHSHSIATAGHPTPFCVHA